MMEFLSAARPDVWKDESLVAMLREASVDSCSDDSVVSESAASDLVLPRRCLRADGSGLEPLVGRLH